MGCGDGRDAAEIVKRTAWYEGVDPSEGLLDIARRELPETSFVKARAQTYTFPGQLDVIFAFASLLHVPAKELRVIFTHAAESLKPGGVFYISLKEREVYTEEIKKDAYGERMFYFYTPALIIELAGTAFKPVHEAHQIQGDTAWFTIALQRK